MNELGIRIKHHYKVECFRDGELIWSEEMDNLLTTVGRNKYLDACLKTGLTSPAWYLGLKNAGTPDAADTMGSHATWTENTTYSNANRPAFTPGTIASGSVSNSGSVASFTMSGSTTIYGFFMVDNNTKGGTTGTLLGVADFAASQAVQANDVLNVTVTASIAAA